MQMYRFIYISNAAPELTFDELNDLAELGASFRQDDGLTGVLVNLDDAYFGLLEGEEEKVIQAIDRLTHSPYHHGMIVMSRRKTIDLMYSDWSVGFRSKTLTDKSALFFYAPSVQSVLDRTAVAADIEFDVFLYSFFESNNRYAALH